jgi:cell division topological specificity factor
MSWFKALFKAVFGDINQSSASLAKERLKIIVSHERGRTENAVDFLPALQKELIEVIAKYIDVDKEQVRVELERNRDRDVLELNVIFPERPMQRPVESTV